MTQSYGLTAHHLALLFPFHFVIDRRFRIVQLGPNIGAKFDSDICLNAYMDDFFSLTTPASLLNWRYLHSLENEFCVLRHKKTQIDFSAKILPSSPDTLLFLIKPLINTEAYLDQFGFDAADFSNHDLINDLFQHVNKTNSKKDINLNDALIAQEAQLTEIRQLLETQEAESRKLAHIISRSSYWVVVADTKGNVEWVNTAFLENSGLTQEAVIGCNLSQLLTESPDQFQVIRETLLNQSSYQKEILLNIGGEAKWIDMDIRPLFGDEDSILNFIAIGRDITVQKQAQIRSSQLTVELNSIFDLSVDGFVSFDEGGKVSRVNTAFLTMTGLKQSQLECIAIDQFEVLIADISERFEDSATKDSSSVSIIKIVQPDSNAGAITTIRRTIKQVFDSDSLSPRVINYFQDITHEYELSRMKGQFLSTAAHELRTPMASIFGFSNLLIKRDFNPAQSKEILENIFRQATRMTKLINDLLDLARIEAIGKLSFITETIDVASLIDTALQEFKIITDKRVVEFQHPDKALPITGNFDKLIQVLLNLLTNAHKYSFPDKVIKITILESTLEGHDYVGFCILDAGIGMTRSDLNKLFEPFFRSASTSGIPGTGLGMRIVKEIIELHNGKIEVESELNIGTTVTCLLPKA
ncbi:ATP-binding protein [Methylotenera versatilis]|uniref:ATP-binding protein n=1 Tax=Methylotenera versatilis TaxID=1055487 RepID=UPI00064668B2|nr:ATP-binding protein [Methylotenera versatilis]